ncbi:PIF-4 [Aratus pisonii nudivirus]|nr:PIF-4 [Aratus pisonii nudivirus]
MNFSKTDYIILIGSIILIIFILIIIGTNNKHIIEQAVNRASEATQFNTTYFEIYDRSADENNCNRLIIVQPFQWHIWAYSGVVYLLNESNKSCPINYTPAILVPTNKSDDISNQVFKDVCINKVFNQVVTSYTDSIQPVIIDFEIEELQSQPNKFTILDALNFLFTSYLTMDEDTTASLAKGPIDLKLLNITKKNINEIYNRFVHIKINNEHKNKMKKTLQLNKKNSHDHL